MRHDWWEDWRYPLRTAAILLTIILFVALYVVRPQQWWTFTTDGVLTRQELTDMRFFLDSLYIVRLGAHENAPYPIRVAVFYAGTGVSMPPREVRQAIEQAIESRVGASWVLAQENPVHHLLAPSVTVAYDLWSKGGVRGEIVLRCPHQHGGPDAPVGVVEGVTSMRAGISDMEHLSASISRFLGDAAQLRCEESVPGFSADSPRFVTSIAIHVDRIAAPSPDSAKVAQ